METPTFNQSRLGVLGMGNALVDLIFQLDSDSDLSQLHLPKGSMTLVDNDRANEIMYFLSDKTPSLATGGSASNTISTLSKLGIRCGFLGRIGNADSYGAFYKNDLLKHGIIPHLSYSGNNTGMAITLMTPDSERTFATCLGAAASLGAEDLSEEIFEPYRVFHIEGYMVQNHELMEAAIDMAKKLGMKISYDMASYNIVEENKDFIARMIEKGIDILFANQEEASAFTGKDELEALCLLARKTPTCVVKLGGRGSIIMHEGKLSIVEAETVKKIDSNGAGDSYAGGFLYGFCRQLPIKSCGEIASTVATEVVKIVGPKLDEQQWENVLPKIRKIENEAESWLKSGISI